MSFLSYEKLFIFKIPASGTDFQNTGLSPASAKSAVNYRPGRWNASGNPMQYDAKNFPGVFFFM